MVWELGCYILLGIKNSCLKRPNGNKEEPGRVVIIITIRIADVAKCDTRLLIYKGQSKCDTLITYLIAINDVMSNERTR